MLFTGPLIYNRITLLDANTNKQMVSTYLFPSFVGKESRLTLLPPVARSFYILISREPLGIPTYKIFTLSVGSGKPRSEMNDNTYFQRILE